MKVAVIAVLAAGLVAGMPSAGRGGCCPSPVGWDYAPAWSPTGGLLAFTRISYFPGLSGTYVVRPDGSGLKQVSLRAFYSWAPDGARLVVGNGGLDVVDTSGRVVHALTRESGDGYPAWSPDGRWIAFRRDSGVWLMPAEGGTPGRLAAARLPRGNPRISWAPDSFHVAYTASRQQGERFDDEIHIVDRNGAGDRVLASGPGHERDPVWSPDGTRIAFSAPQGRQHELFVIDADGTDLLNLSSSPGYDAMPAWSPDGATIAFASGRPGAEGLYLVPASGGPARRMTGFPEAREPAWSPDGLRVVFSGRGDCRRAGILVLSASNGKPDLITNDCHVMGTEADDWIKGTFDRDIVHGLGGNDVISLETGDDAAFGDSGNDVLRGGRMNDVLVGGAGRDTLIGHRGNDRFRSADGEVDKLSCGAQRDWVVADRLDRIGRDCERVRRVK